MLSHALPLPSGAVGRAAMSPPRHAARPLQLLGEKARPALPAMQNPSVSSRGHRRGAGDRGTSLATINTSAFNAFASFSASAALLVTLGCKGPLYQPVVSM